MDADFTPWLRDGRVWVAELDGRLVASVVVVDEEQGFELRALAVRLELQRQGIGRALIAHAEQVARAAGASVVRLYTNAKLSELVAYYATLGYTEVERRVDRGIDRVFMTKRVG